MGAVAYALWFQISEPGQGKLIVLLVLMRMPYVIALAVFLGWAYMKTNNIWLCVLIHGVNNWRRGQHLILI